jgi:hypothetical protein
VVEFGGMLLGEGIVDETRRKPIPSRFASASGDRDRLSHCSL